MDLVPLPWTWGAVVELFGARLAMVNFVRLPSSCGSTSLLCKESQSWQPTRLHTQWVSLSRYHLTCTNMQAARAHEYHPPAPTVCSESTIDLQHQSFLRFGVTWPNRSRRGTLICAFSSTLHGELHVASLSLESHATIVKTRSRVSSALPFAGSSMPPAFLWKATPPSSRHAHQCLQLCPSRRAPRSQPFSGRPRHHPKDTLKGVFSSTLRGELHVTSFLLEAFINGHSAVGWPQSNIQQCASRRHAAQTDGRSHG